MTHHQAATARAPGYVTLFNPLTKRLPAAGVPLGPNGLVTVRGRRTGVPRTTPVAVIETRGRRWIWSPWGEVQWVRNLRAAGRATLTVHGREEPVQASELDPKERVGFFRDVLGPLARSTRGGTWFIRLADRVDLGRPEEAAGGTAVFELRIDPGEADLAAFRRSWVGR
jgi:deazaflavin-dependent oxidoreductase (nitroreductase family)